MVRVSDVIKMFIFVVAIITAVLFGIGSIIYFVGYYKPTQNNNYEEGQCAIISNSILLQCNNNDGKCLYYGRINIQYSGLPKAMTGIFQVISAATQEEADQKMAPYAVGLSITCYYPKDNDGDLRIKPKNIDGAGVAFGFGITFFVLAGIAFMFLLLGMFFLCINKD